MRVAVFGASGRTGGLLVERCLAAGYEVTVLVRTPARTAATFPWRDRVRVVEGSVFDAAAVRQTLSGAEAATRAEVVLSALGARSLKQESVLERAVPVIVEAMRAEGVQRIVALGSAGALEDSLKKQGAWQRWIIQKIVYNTVLKWAVASQISQWKTLAASGLDFTMVMPPMLTEGKGRGLERVRVDGEALPPRGSRIAREDVADFMMAQIEGGDWVGKGVYVAW
ncbi:MAG: NAD(P)H-binding protein [Acidobacteriaceae bacterium]